jgi:hypothetical protein
MSGTEFCITIDTKEEQFWKAQFPIEVAEFGIIIDNKEG